MADVVKNVKKKKSRRLKRSVRRTLGTLFLVSALVVAAIPTEGLRAAETGDGVMPYAETNYESDLKWDQSKSKIPLVAENEENIFCDADGIFNFAWVKESATSANRVAVILGYTGRTLENNELVISGTVDAYAKYKSNDSSNGGYVAVSQSREPLYYMSVERKVDKTHEETKVMDGKETTVTVIDSYTCPSFSPCVKEDTAWNRKGDIETYYYYRYGTKDKYIADGYLDLIEPGTVDESILTTSGAFVDQNGYVYKRSGTDTDHQWIRGQTVAYIGNQYLVPYVYPEGTTPPEGTVMREYKVASGDANTDPTKGVFAKQSNIQKLTVGKDLIGIGNYAFYNCALLSYVQFGNGLQEVGKSAFELCTNMYGVGFDFGSNLNYISDRAFAQSGLQTFALPVGVTEIYDHVFDGCTSLTDVDLTGEKQPPVLNPDTNQLVQPVTTLNKLGCSVFKGCTGLTEIKFPATMNTPVHLDNFENCSGLKRICVMNNAASFVPHAAGDAFTADVFKATVQQEFYFEAADSSVTHTFASDNGIAFKYSDQNLFELVVIEKNAGGSVQSRVRYQVTPVSDGVGKLYNYKVLEGTVVNAVIPEKVGPYGISSLDEGSFTNNCELEKVTIPASVTAINARAFKGCHNLKHVIFTKAENITFIGEDAFATQKATNCGDTLADNPSLSFTGTVGEGIKPFDYAMSDGGKINEGTQQTTYITYYSGWPYNLEIRYVDDTPLTPGDGVATLISYPTRSRIYQYTKANYPYITEDMEKAAVDAFANYDKFINGQPNDMNDNSWAIINASLNPVIPQGIKAVKEGLFNGAVVVKNEGGDVSGGDGANEAYRVERTTEKPDTDLQTITFTDISEYTPYMFDGCTGLKTINITGGIAKIDEYAFALKEPEKHTYSLTNINMTDGQGPIGDYAFDKAETLTSVTISPNVADMGKRPFRGCTKLTNVSFSGGPYFDYGNGMIYGLKNNEKDSVVECLEYVAGTLTSSLFAGVQSLKEEAFMGCRNLRSVDLTASSIGDIPANAFNNTGELSVKLPSTCKSIQAYAFHDSKLWSIEIPASVRYINDKAFDTPTTPSSNGDWVPKLEFVCSSDSETADIYANAVGHENIEVVPIASTRSCTVSFMVDDESGKWKPFIEDQVINAGTAARIPELTPTKEGFVFEYWYLSPAGPNISEINMKDVQGDMTFVPRWRLRSTTEATTTVRFLDYDDKVLSTQHVVPGGDAIRPEAPVREGYRFIGWRPALTNIPEGPDGWTYDIYAQYEKSDSSNPGGNNPSGNNPSGNNPGGSNPGGTVSGNSVLYTLTVKNGSGSGSYAAGSQPIVIANNPASGQEFSHWTITPANTPIASTSLSATVITMPAANVTVTANYKAKTGVTTSTGNTSNNNSYNRPNGGNSGTINNSGTTVVIDKNGLSNTGVVAVTVNGSSDNFQVRISESNEATEAVLRALMAEYGNDLSDIKYFPMDISLYDATGKTKITDTTGLKVNITLPLPDSLIRYAGNNKVAGVVNDRLDKLSPRFTTIDGVACVTFTAEHFSPYVIYVDVSRLSDGAAEDYTPKTGDGIHPKWFLSIGLACLSFVMFMQKDSRKKEKIRVKARA